MHAGYPLQERGYRGTARADSEEDDVSDRPRVVVVGGGFAGFHAARNLAKRLGDESEIVLVNTTDYFLYLPLLPEVAAGVLEPRRIAVPLAASLPGVRVVLGEVDEIDLAQISGSAGRTPRAGATASPTTACCWRSAA